MNQAQYDEVISELEKKSAAEIAAKRPAYTIGSDDVLANFKRGASLTGLKPLQVWSIYTMKHMDSIMAYIKDGTESNESIDGRFADLLNYIKLGFALYEEEKPNVVTFYNAEDPSQTQTINIREPITA